MEEDKFLLLYALLKLSLIRGKSLLFVNTLERSYRLRLFLEQFSIPACVLNGELPLRSRCALADASAETRRRWVWIGEMQLMFLFLKRLEDRIWA